MDYLDHPAFDEEHKGPWVRDRYGQPLTRDPSPVQVRRRARAIRASWSEPEARMRHMPAIRGYEIPVYPDPE